MKNIEKLVLVPFADYKRLINDSQTLTENTNKTTEKKDITTPDHHPEKDSTEDFNVNDFVSYLKRCEDTSCDTLPGGGHSKTSTINTEVIEPQTKKIKREWLIL